MVYIEETGEHRLGKHGYSVGTGREMRARRSPRVADHELPRLWNGSAWTWWGAPSPAVRRGGGQRVPAYPPGGVDSVFGSTVQQVHQAGAVQMDFVGVIGLLGRLQ